MLLVVCSNYVSTIKQNLKDYAARDRRSPLPPPPKEDGKKPALSSRPEWSLRGVGRDEAPPDGGDNSQEPLQTSDDDVTNNRLFAGSRSLLDHEAFDLDTLKKPADAKTTRRVDEMVRNSTPYLAMRLCPVYELEPSKNLMPNKPTESKYPFVEKMDEVFRDGVAYDERPKSLTTKKDGKQRRINLMRLMETIDRLELDEDDDIESIINKYV